MKITKAKLREIIREEIQSLSEFTPSYKKTTVGTYSRGNEFGLVYHDPKGIRKYTMSKDEKEEWDEMNTNSRERFAKKMYKKSKLDTREKSGYEKYLSQGGRDWD